MRRFIVGVMGAGQSADANDIDNAYELGRLIAQEGWILLSGGRDIGVMEAVNQGAKEIAGSITLGILPSVDSKPSPFVDIVIITDMHNARNNINVLSSDVVVACGCKGAGTVSEIALALKAGKPVILLGADTASITFFQKLGNGAVRIAEKPGQAIDIIKNDLA
ncbi:MAG: cytochrome [Proteobacteria bacterium]|nr:cytochrome [Pseudomonadota bacterium]